MKRIINIIFCRYHYSKIIRIDPELIVRRFKNNINKDAISVGGLNGEIGLYDFNLIYYVRPWLASPGVEIRGSIKPLNDGFDFRAIIRSPIFMIILLILTGILFGVIFSSEKDTATLKLLEFLKIFGLIYCIYAPVYWIEAAAASKEITRILSDKID